MNRVHRAFTVFALCLAASFSTAADRIDIVIDNSFEMWQPMGNGPPRFVALREVLLDFAAASAFGPIDLEINLFLMGGGGSASDLEGCADSPATLAGATGDPDTWKSVLAGLRPGGRRPLAQAIIAAATHAPDTDRKRRLILITAGNDQCHQDVVRAANVLSSPGPAIDLMIIGLGLDAETAKAAALLAPTRNVRDPGRLADNLIWALGPDPTADPREVEFSFDLGTGGRTLNGKDAVLTTSFTDLQTIVPIEDGVIRTRLVPGRYRATIPGNHHDTFELAGLNTTSIGMTFELAVAQEVTLEVVNLNPNEGEPVFVQFWGAPTGTNWVTVAPESAPLGHYLVRAEAVGEQAEVELHPSGTARELEARFVHEPTPGAFQLLGSIPFHRDRSTVNFELPETVEGGADFQLTWTGPDLWGDRISINPRGADEALPAMCLFTGSGSPITVVAPAEPGNYVIRYHSVSGSILQSAALEVFEVLATLDAVAEAAPGQEISVAWTGPDRALDFLCIADPEAPGNEYLEWSATTLGNPLRLRSPAAQGTYELRYVRGGDEKILARQSFEVISVPVTIHVPGVVDSGTRFAVRLEGTPAPKDIVAISEVGADIREFFDWSYATPGVQISLGAPFEAGDYEIRYIDGREKKITTRIPIRVR